MSAGESWISGATSPTTAPVCAAAAVTTSSETVTSSVALAARVVWACAAEPAASRTSGARLTAAKRHAPGAPLRDLDL